MMVKGAKALEMWCRRVTEGYPVSLNKNRLASLVDYPVYWFAQGFLHVYANAMPSAFQKKLPTVYGVVNQMLDFCQVFKYLLI